MYTFIYQAKNKICKIENLDNAVNLVRLDLSDNEIELI
jgi:Leucine-rich repeat (LRR) protein